MASTENLLNLVETCGAEILVIDDMNGLLLELIVAKGFPDKAITLEMSAPDKITGVIEVGSRK